MSKEIQIIKDAIRDVPDFPKPGIVFKDITTLLADPKAFGTVIDLLVNKYKDMGVDYVLGMESRGFIFAAPVSQALNAGMTLVRKPGKLPAKTISQSYELEYGSDTLELHADAFPAGAKVLILDDLLATGGTAQATVELVRSLGAEVVGAAFVIELDFLNGRSKLDELGVEVYSLVHY